MVRGDQARRSGLEGEEGCVEGVEERHSALCLVHGRRRRSCGRWGGLAWSLAEREERQNGEFWALLEGKLSLLASARA